MKSKEAYKIIDEGWVKKRIGYLTEAPPLPGEALYACMLQPDEPLQVLGARQAVGLGRVHRRRRRGPLQQGRHHPGPERRLALHRPLLAGDLILRSGKALPYRHTRAPRQGRPFFVAAASRDRARPARVPAGRRIARPAGALRALRAASASASDC